MCVSQPSLSLQLSGSLIPCCLSNCLCLSPSAFSPTVWVSHPLLSFQLSMSLTLCFFFNCLGHSSLVLSLTVWVSLSLLGPNTMKTHVLKHLLHYHRPMHPLKPALYLSQLNSSVDTLMWIHCCGVYSIHTYKMYYLYSLTYLFIQSLNKAVCCATC